MVKEELTNRSFMVVGICQYTVFAILKYMMPSMGFELVSQSSTVQDNTTAQF